MKHIDMIVGMPYSIEEMKLLRLMDENEEFRNVVYNSTSSYDIRAYLDKYDPNFEYNVKWSEARKIHELFSKVA